MRLAAIALVLLLAGCTMPAEEPRPDVTDLQSAIAELDGVDTAEVRAIVYDDGRQTEIVTEMTTSDAAGLDDLVAAATQLIDHADFASLTRELHVTIGESLLSVQATGGEALEPGISSIFTQWVADPRVAAVSWSWVMSLTLVGDGTTDGSLIEAVYNELVTDVVVLDDGGVDITDPGSFSIAAAGHPYSDNRFGLAREVDALEGVSACSFNLENSSDSSMIHTIYCAVDGDLDAAGDAINALLDARGLRDSTDVRLQGADESILFNDGSYTFDES